MEEALECLAVKQAAEGQMQMAFRRKPKQCTFRYCLRYVDASCTVCPYCGNPLQSGEDMALAALFQRSGPALSCQGCD